MEFVCNPTQPSLRETLQTSDLWSGNYPKEGQGLRYSGNSPSLMFSSPKLSIKNLPSSAKVLQPSRPSVIMSRNSYTKGPSIIANSLSKKRSFDHDQTEYCNNKVRKRINSLSPSKPSFSSKDFCLGTLENLQNSSQIQVYLPRAKLGHSVRVSSLASSNLKNIDTK